MAVQTLSLLATVVDFMGTLLIGGSALGVIVRFVRRSAAPAAADALRGKLAIDLVTALSIKSGAGLIRTLTVTTWSGFGLILAIIVLRFFLGQTLKVFVR